VTHETNGIQVVDYNRQVSPGYFDKFPHFRPGLSIYNGRLTYPDIMAGYFTCSQPSRRLTVIGIEGAADEHVVAR
jgi:hypothetical protein